MRTLSNLYHHEIDFTESSTLYGATTDCYRHCKEDTCDFGYQDVEHSIYDDDGELGSVWTTDNDTPCVDV